MPRFRFQLEPLLKARRTAEEEKQRALATIQRQRIQLEDALRLQQQQIAADKSEQRERLTGVLNLNELRLGAGATLAAVRKANRLALELAGVHKRLEAARLELIEARRKRRVVELLRERRFEQWKQAENKAETAMLDELAVIAAARQSVERAGDDSSLQKEHMT